MLIEMFLKTAMAPAVVVGLLMLLFGSAPEPWRSRMQGLIVAAGFVASSYLLSGPPTWPPEGGAASLAWVAIWFGLFSWVAAPGTRAKTLFRGTWIIVGVILVVYKLQHAILNSPVQSRNVLALVCAGWGMWSALERGLRYSKPLTVVSMGMVTFTAASVLFLLESSLLMSQLMTSLAVLAGGLAVMAWLFSKRLSLHAVLPFLSGFIGVVMVTGYVFLDINPWLMLSLAIPCAALFLKDLFKLTSTSALTDAIVTIVLAALPLGYILWKVSLTSGPLY